MGVKKRKKILIYLTSGMLVCNLTLTGVVGNLQASTAEFMEAMKALGAVKSMQQIQPITLDPVVREKIETVYVEIYDSSGLGVPLDKLTERVKKTFEEKGYKVVNSPSEAGYVVQVNLTNIYFGQEKKGSSGILSSVLGTVGGYAGLVLGLGFGSGIGMQLGTALGSAVGEKLGEVAESKALEALFGKKYQFFGTFDVKVVENYQGQQKTYVGKYPLAGKGDNFSMEKFTEDLAISIGSAFAIFNKSATVKN